MPPSESPKLQKKTNRPKGYISQVKSISYGPVKMARPEKLDALGHFAVAREFTMALRQHCTSGLPKKIRSEATHCNSSPSCNLCQNNGIPSAASCEMRHTKTGAWLVETKPGRPRRYPGNCSQFRHLMPHEHPGGRIQPHILPLKKCLDVSQGWNDECIITFQT